ncbi:hypothetical protein ACFX1S_027996 [Malus domestica]
MLSETSSIEMCIQGMQWGLQYILQGIKPRTFEELATRAHDMELSIAHHGKKESISDYKIDKVLETKVENRSLTTRLTKFLRQRWSRLRGNPPRKQ